MTYLFILNTEYFAQNFRKCRNGINAAYMKNITFKLVNGAAFIP